MSTNDRLGHLGYAFILIGMAGIALGEPVGWLFRLAGEAVWVGVGLRLRLTSIWSWGAIFMVLDVAAWIRWRGAL